MKKISIYIDIEYKGNFACGTGKISIVLEMMRGDIPVTKEHFLGYKETTKNRVALLACIAALSYVKESCEITIHIDSAYIIGSVPFLKKWQQEGMDTKKNSDLWKKYIKAAENHLIEFINEKENEYSRAMAIQRNITEIVILTDYKQENEF